MSSTLGPLPVPAGTNATAQTVEAYNIGDGSLTLSLASSVPWITTASGSARPCATTTAAANCIPLQLTLATSALSAGTYTGTVTVSSSNTATIDAPQTITVTVRVGAVEAYVAPGSSADIPFTTSKLISYRATTQDGNNWLSLALDGTGSFRFVFPYRIHIQPPAGMAPGNYNGSVVTTGSSVASENQTIPVTMRLTAQPIASVSPNPVQVQLAEGAPPLVLPFSPYLPVSNLGSGTLAVASVSPTGAWLKTDAFPFLSIDPAGLSPTQYNGSIAIASNAANSLLTVPVNLTIVPKGPPVIGYQQVLDNGTYMPGDTVAQGDVMIVKGDQLSFSPYTPGQAPPLATQLGGASVLVNGKAVPLFYSSYGQIAFQMPVDAPVGTVQVQVQRDGVTGNTVTVDVAVRAPRILAVVNQNGSVNLPDGSQPAKVGDVLTIYAIGLGPTSPAAVTGAPAPSAEPLARVTPGPLVNFGATIGGADVEPAFAGLTPTYAGLYQVNVVVPENTPHGTVPIIIGFPDTRSNVVFIAIQ